MFPLRMDEQVAGLLEVDYIDGANIMMLCQ